MPDHTTAATNPSDMNSNARSALSISGSQSGPPTMRLATNGNDMRMRVNAPTNHNRRRGPALRSPMRTARHRANPVVERASHTVEKMARVSSWG